MAPSPIWGKRRWKRHIHFLKVMVWKWHTCPLFTSCWWDFITWPHLGLRGAGKRNPCPHKLLQGTTLHQGEVAVGEAMNWSLKELILFHHCFQRTSRPFRIFLPVTSQWVLPSTLVHIALSEHSFDSLACLSTFARGLHFAQNSFSTFLLCLVDFLFVFQSLN